MASCGERLRPRFPAVADVNSVSWLLGGDDRFPSGALLTHILAANTCRAAGAPQWDRHLEAARDVIAYIENRGPSNWERFYLADYYYKIGAARERPLPNSLSRSIGSYGWAGIFNTHFCVDPKRKIAAVLFMQVLPFYDENCIELLLVGLATALSESR